VKPGQSVTGLYCSEFGCTGRFQAAASITSDERHPETLHLPLVTTCLRCLAYTK